MRDQHGNTIVYKGSASLGGITWHREDYREYRYEIDKDEVLKFKATIIEHNVYEGEKQTVVSRPKVQEEKVENSTEVLLQAEPQCETI